MCERNVTVAQAAATEEAPVGCREAAIAVTSRVRTFAPLSRKCWNAAG